MNIRKGASRTAYFLLGLIWLFWLGVSIAEGNAFKFGQQLVNMLLFTLGYMVFCKAIAWVYNGFAEKQ